MKPAPFAYHRPATLGETFDLLDRYGQEARILAGGRTRHDVPRHQGVAFTNGVQLSYVAIEVETHDALAPVGARVTRQPITPAVVLTALGRR